ncbi:MAG TPA: hypothetical protein VG269_12165 [Tepidisphaeraceae bacterium]|jgi:hypothetical protein|nr:hypothetical protein [Tepidisphaeraceae bacterium]
MFVIYNRPGIAIVAAGCVAALVSNRLCPPGLSGSTFLALGLTWCVADVFYRFKWGSRRFLHHHHGGHLYFIPMWALGLLFLYMGLHTSNTSLRARQPLPPPTIRPAMPATTAQSQHDEVP